MHNKFGFNFSKYDEVYKESIKLLEKPSKEEIIFDAGCGIGITAKYLPGCKLVGVDIDEEALKKAAENKEFIKLIRASLTGLPFKENQFEKSISIQTLYYIPDWKKAIDEIMRVTKNFAIVTMPNFTYCFLRHPNLWIKKILNKKPVYSFFSNVSKKEFENYLKEKYNFKIYYISKNLKNLKGKYLCNEYVYVISK